MDTQTSVKHARSWCQACTGRFFTTTDAENASASSWRGEPTVRVAGPMEDQPVPTVRVVGSSGSGTRSGVGSRASETNTEDRETKRVRFTESRGQERQSEDVEEVTAKAEEQHLDADVEVLAHKTWRVEDVVGDAADAAPEQMNSFLQSKTELLEKIEESLRPLCMVDLNNDEVME